MSVKRLLNYTRARIKVNTALKHIRVYYYTVPVLQGEKHFNTEGDLTSPALAALVNLERLDGGVVNLVVKNMPLEFRALTYKVNDGCGSDSGKQHVFLLITTQAVSEAGQRTVGYLDVTLDEEPVYHKSRVVDSDAPNFAVEAAKYLQDSIPVPLAAKVSLEYRKLGIGQVAHSVMLYILRDLGHDRFNVIEDATSGSFYFEKFVSPGVGYTRQSGGALRDDGSVDYSFYGRYCEPTGEPNQYYTNLSSYQVHILNKAFNLEPDQPITSLTA